MKNNQNPKKAALLFFAVVFSIAFVEGQTLTIQSSEIKIAGTTNVHDFTTESKEASGQLVFNGNKPIALTVEIPVRSIKNGQKTMDKKTHETFNDTQYPTISFKMTDLNSIVKDGTDILINVTGDLSMGGTSNKVTLDAKGKEVRPGVYIFEGSLPIVMSEWKLKAPTAMLGVMKVHDKVIVSYNVTFEGPVVELFF